MRPLRIEFEGAWYHVMNRGANHQCIFITEEHRRIFLSLLEDITNKFYVEIHAYCLMDNHYHILIKTPFPNLGKVMQYLDGVYTQRFNRSSKRDGPLFRGRYKAILIDSDSYLLQLSRYIHLNPVESNLCQDPFDYQWSSYRFYIQFVDKPKWLYCKMILTLMTGDNLQKSYLHFVMQGVDEEIANFYNKKQLPVILGSDLFIKKHVESVSEKIKEICGADIKRCKEFPDISMIMNAVIKYYQIDTRAIFASTTGKLNIHKMIVIFLAKQLGQLSHKKISEYFGLKPSSISTALKRFDLTKNKCQKLEEEIGALTSVILTSFDKTRP